MHVHLISRHLHDLYRIAGQKKKKRDFKTLKSTVYNGEKTGTEMHKTLSENTKLFDPMYF